MFATQKNWCWSDFGHSHCVWFFSMSVMSTLVQPQSFLLILLVTYHSSQQEAKWLNMPHLPQMFASRQEGPG